MSIQLGMPLTKAWMWPGPTHTAVLRAGMPHSAATSERRLPVPSSIPFMHSTKILSEISNAVTPGRKERSAWALMEIMMTCEALTARSRSSVRHIAGSKVTYSFAPSLFNCSKDLRPRSPHSITLLPNIVAWYQARKEPHLPQPRTETFIAISSQTGRGRA